MVCRATVLTGEDIDTRAIDDIDAIPDFQDIDEDHTTEGDITNGFHRFW
jgi:hypothetical protein